jgi:hypothetical protein
MLANILPMNFSLLPLDHLASKFELFWALWVFEKIFKDFPH